MSGSQRHPLSKPRLPIGRFVRGTATRPIGGVKGTPLVDATLALLFVVLLAAPLLVQAVETALPRGAAPLERKGELRLTLDASGGVFWEGRAIGAAAFTALLAEVSARRPQPELHIVADRATRYEHIARTIGAARAAGIARLSFVTMPGEPYEPAR